jgi:hypothetical protein
MISRLIENRLPRNHLLLSVSHYYKGLCIVGTGENGPGGAVLCEKVYKIGANLGPWNSDERSFCQLAPLYWKQWSILSLSCVEGVTAEMWLENDE